MFSNVKTKVRSLIGDISKSGTEVHTYTTSLIFTLTEPNVTSLTTTTINGVALDSGETATFSATTGKVTLAGVSLTAGDEIEFTFAYYAKYSETEIANWIRAALVYVSLFDECKDFELEDDGADSYYFEPTPDNKELDMIALVTSILLNPDWSEYKLPNVTIKYPRTQDRDTKIRKLITRVQSRTGWSGLIALED